MILVWIMHLIDLFQKKAHAGQMRSPGWRHLRNEFIKKNPWCKGCGGTKKLEVHHIISFSDDPDLELVESNLITLCKSGKYGIRCHQLLGHMGNFRKTNKTCLEDADYWRIKIKS